MRAGWFALILGLVVGGGVAMAILAPVSPAEHELGPVLEALDLRRGPSLDARRAAAVAEAAERCLAAHGVTARVPVEPPPAIPDADLDPVGWAERWGFGITTTVGVSSTPLPLAHAGPLDALGARCRNEAADTIYGLRDRLLAPLRSPLAALGATIDGDPASRAADAAWIACARAATAAGRPPLPAPPEPGRLDGVRAWFADRAQRDVPGVPDLERRVAAAIARCDAVRVDARRRAAWPHEVAFVQVHGDELRRVGAAIRAAEAAYPSASP